jgi:hypothetical protein
MRWPLLVNLAEFPFIVVELNVLPRTATRRENLNLLDVFRRE